MLTKNGLPPKIRSKIKYYTVTTTLKPRGASAPSIFCFAPPVIWQIEIKINVCTTLIIVLVLNK